MAKIHTYTEKLFSYGTLQYEAVQLSTFGRKLYGNPDTLAGFDITKIEIKDQDVIAVSGETHHLMLKFTGKLSDQIEGVVFDITPAELEQADSYEVDDYKRVSVQLASGITAWVYVSANEVA